ncbi:MAG: transcription termination factor Rho [Bacillota bacterium]|nr:transcription termination factor Rho [Bacillota bacterium]
MQDIDFSKRTKADLVNLVRLSKVMPVSRAQRMPKAELIAELQRLTAQASADAETQQAEIIELAAPGRAAASRQIEGEQRQRSSRRRSVLMPVPNGDTAETASPPSRKISVMDATHAAQEEAEMTESAAPAATTAPDVPAALPSERDAASVTTPRAKKRSTKKAAAKKAKVEPEPSAAAEGGEDEPKRPRKRRSAPAEETEADAVVEADAVSEVDADAKDDREREAAETEDYATDGAVDEEGAAEESAEDENSSQESTDDRDERHGRNKRRKQRSERREGERPRDEKEGSSRAARSIDSGEEVTGVLEVMPDGYGFLRRENYIQGPRDVYVPPQFIRRFQLRPGDLISGPVRNQRENDRYQAIYFIKTVNDLPPDQMMRRPHFDKLTPIHPNQRFNLETTRNELSTRIIDLISPIGKGQRGMIVSPPKAGKTILLQKIANAISINSPKARLIVLLIDERPEEVTDMQRSITGEVVYSTFDKTPENHVKITELVLERAMRLVELGEDVIILLDSITRMSRAYNLTISPTGRTLSGGLDPGALYGPKRFFGAARNIENGGSLTIVATALIDTGSRMDEVIFEEFKGTGNMEVHLDRKLSERRIFPAIDINRSGTRREELLLDPRSLDAVWTIRKAFGQLENSNVTETIIGLLRKTNDNEHFVSSINVSLGKSGIDPMRPTPGLKSANGATSYVSSRSEYER